MPYQITISDQERDILAQQTQAPALSAQQVEQLVHELIRNVWLMQELTRNLRRATQNSSSPSAAEKPAQQPHQEADLAQKQTSEEQKSLSLVELKAQGKQIEQLYVLKNSEQIWHFLETHQYLVPLLIEAYGHVRKHFPSNNLVLAHIPDPEIPGAEDLVLFISYGPDWRKSHEDLKQFGRDWWHHIDLQAHQDLCIKLGGI